MWRSWSDMTKRYTITDEWAGARIDRLVGALHPAVPFGVIQTLLRKGRVTLNGGKVRGGARLAAGDVVEIHGRIEQSGEIASARRAIERLASPPPHEADRDAHGARDSAARRGRGSIGADIPVLYEDNDVMVIDKPRRLVVQPGNRAALGSLLDLLEAYRAERTTPRGRTPPREHTVHAGELPPFPYTPVHRLDRETTGALVIAKTRPTARMLGDAFATGRVTKMYLALVEGVPSPRRGAITIPLRVTKGRRSTAKPESGGKRAESYYRLRRVVGGDRSLLEVRITTGRTHQIRAHLAGIGHPVVGDRRYGGEGRRHGGRKRGEGPGMDRRGGRRLRAGRVMHLHAWKVSFPHPSGSGTVDVTAPPPAWARER
jgi:23S rRNA pseudouridine955/2504/2580 synthase